VSAQRTRLERFLRRKHHLLTFVGALIVFLTFVIKEGLGDRWNRLAEAIDTAQYIYSVRADTSRENQRFQLLLREIQETEGLVRSHGKSFPNGEEVLLQNMRDAESGNNEVGTALATLNILVGKLPAQDGNRLRLAELSRRVEEVQQETLEVVRLATPAGLRGTPGEIERQVKQSISQAVDLEEPLFLKLGKLREDSDALMANVLRDAEHVREQNSARSTAAWWVSAALFALGWGLGLLGKLYVVPEAAAGED
jgi:hypothetical protein